MNEQQAQPVAHAKPANTMLSVIMKREEFSQFRNAVKMTGETHMKEINDLLSGKSMHTAFIPSNMAFEEGKKEMDKWMKAFPCPSTDPKEMEMKKQEILAGLLKYHLATGSFNKNDLKKGGSIRSLSPNGEMICVFQIKDLDGIFFNGIRAKLEGDGITTDNGRIYRISNILLPVRECTPMTKHATQGSM